MRVLPVGDAAALIELGRAIDPALNARARGLEAALRAAPFDGMGETVPAYASVLVTFDPRRASLAMVESAARAVMGAMGTAVDDVPRRTHEIQTVYDGADLPAVATQAGLAVGEVIARHAAREYTAYFLGFAPGFAYLGDLERALAIPRRATPRPRVPAGSVAIAGSQTAVYPFSTAGGWHLLGRTAARMFDPAADPPALIAPGDRVRFVPVEALNEAPRPHSAQGPAAPVVEVLDPGLLTTVQDGGRRGHRRLGVPWCGAADPVSLERANAAVGNDPGAAALECTVAGPALRFLAPVRFAVAGADLGAMLERSDLGPWPVPPGLAVRARPGNLLRFAGRRHGFRAYVAVAGGIAVPVVLGSRSTDLMAGFGGLDGRALRAGDLLGSGRAADPAPAAGGAVPRWPSAEATVRVVPGPQADMFTPAARDALLADAYAVGPLSDRVACRLHGAALAHRGAGEIVTDGMLPGCIQVPPDGQPIVMLADCPTTGGYPKIATVVTADLPLLAQLVPGEGRVRFVPA